MDLDQSYAPSGSVNPPTLHHHRFREVKLIWTIPILRTFHLVLFTLVRQILKLSVPLRYVILPSRRNNILIIELLTEPSRKAQLEWMNAFLGYQRRPYELLTHTNVYIPCPLLPTTADVHSTAAYHIPFQPQHILF